MSGNSQCRVMGRKRFVRGMTTNVFNLPDYKNSCQVFAGLQKPFTTSASAGYENFLNCERQINNLTTKE